MMKKTSTLYIHQPTAYWTRAGLYLGWSRSVQPEEKFQEYNSSGNGVCGVGGYKSMSICPYSGAPSCGGHPFDFIWDTQNIWWPVVASSSGLGWRYGLRNKIWETQWEKEYLWLQTPVGGDVGKSPTGDEASQEGADEDHFETKLKSVLITFWQNESSFLGR